VICQCCQRVASTRQVTLDRNIGALYMRFHQRIEGQLCRECISKYFWQYTLVNFTLGWWGMISLVLTPIFIIGNTIHYIASLRLPRPGPNAWRTRVEDLRPPPLPTSTAERPE